MVKIGVVTTPSAPRRSASKGRGSAGPPRVLFPGLLLAVLAVVTIAVLAGRGQNHRTGSASPGGTLGPGAPAPGVALPATNGGTVDLSTFRGRRNVLLYFYEHAG